MRFWAIWWQSLIVFQVYVVRKRKLFGPLIPQEIKDLVIAKYREVMAELLYSEPGFPKPRYVNEGLAKN